MSYFCCKGAAEILLALLFINKKLNHNFWYFKQNLVRWAYQLGILNVEFQTTGIFQYVILQKNTEKNHFLLELIFFL